VAEHLSRHWWDGKRLVLGVVPLSWRDQPAAALASLSSGAVTVKSVVEGTMDRPVSCMMVRYLLHGRKGRFRPAWTKFSRAMDRGRKSSRLFRSVFGGPEPFQAGLLQWLRTEQEPWTLVFKGWERIDSDRFEGRSVPGTMSVCRLKAPCRYLQATLETPDHDRWEGGILLHFDDTRNYTVAFLDPSARVHVARLKGGRWVYLSKRMKLPPPGPSKGRRFEVSRDGEKVYLTVDGKFFGGFPLPGHTLGLALLGCTLRYRDVEWVCNSPGGSGRDGGKNR
jgi:hypothetical protein